MVTYADILMDVLSKKNPTSIIRISWLYSSFGNNFLTKVINVIQDSDEIKVVGDQFGSYTYACNLANTILFLIKIKNGIQVFIIIQIEGIFIGI